MVGVEISLTSLSQDLLFYFSHIRAKILSLQTLSQIIPLLFKKIGQYKSFITGGKHQPSFGTERGFRSNPGIPFFSFFKNVTKSSSLQESAHLDQAICNAVSDLITSTLVEYSIIMEKKKKNEAGFFHLQFPD